MDIYELLKQTLAARGSQTLTAVQDQALANQVERSQRLKARQVLDVKPGDAVSEGNAYRQAEMDQQSLEWQRGKRARHGVDPADLEANAEAMASGRPLRPDEVVGLSPWDMMDSMSMVGGKLALQKSAADVQASRAELARLQQEDIARRGGGLGYISPSDVIPEEVLPDVLGRRLNPGVANPGNIHPLPNHVTDGPGFSAELGPYNEDSRRLQELLARGQY